jgi:drug/metabolite transporter (DMT)-like permease
MGLTEWLISLEGSPEGARVATILALMAAMLHALFGALQKGRHDPWLSRGAIDIAYGVMSVPLVLFVVPWPEPFMWPIFAGAFLIHTAYKISQAETYSKGAYLVVYPVVRGTGPLFAVLVAGVVFNERFTGVQWGGVAILLSGIFGLALYNLRTITKDRDTMVPALALAVLTGGFVAAYTTYDAWGIRATADPFTFLAWFFMIDGVAMPLIALVRYRRMVNPPDPGPLLRKGVMGAFIAYLSFGSIMLATRIGNVGEAAVLRETSTVFAALIGWVILKEPTGPRRITLMALIALGAVVVELGG